LFPLFSTTFLGLFASIAKVLVLSIWLYKSHTPVSAARIYVGVESGAFIVRLRVLLRIVWVYNSSALVEHDWDYTCVNHSPDHSHFYVIEFHVACQTEDISIFPFPLVRWSARLPLLLIAIPSYF
jgi:hypothetical protein